MLYKLIITEKREYNHEFIIDTSEDLWDLCDEIDHDLSQCSSLVECYEGIYKKGNLLKFSENTNPKCNFILSEIYERNA